jgi:hypothetical protein
MELQVSGQGAAAHRPALPDRKYFTDFPRALNFKGNPEFFPAGLPYLWYTTSKHPPNNTLQRQ